MESARAADLPLSTPWAQPDPAQRRGTTAPAAGSARTLPLYWWLFALAPFVLLAIFPRIPGAGLAADDFGQYLMHAQALASGHAYGAINYVYSQLNRWIGPAATLPGLPLLLAPVLRFGGVGAVPWVMLVLALCFPILAGHYFARREAPVLGLAAAAVCVVSPGIVFNSTQPLTDIPFAAAVWGVALVADGEDELRWGRLLALTVLGGAALLLRTAAVAIVPALLLTALLRRRSGDGLKLALPVVAWLLLGAMVLAAIGPHKLLLVHVRPLEWLRWALRPGHMTYNAGTYAQGMLDVQFGLVPHSGAFLVLRVLALGLTVLGVLEWMKRNPRSFVAVFAVVYGLMLLVIPLADDRYLWPLLPLTSFGLMNAVRWLVERRFQRRVAVRAAAALALVVGLLATVGTATARRPISFGEQPQGRELLAYLRALSTREPIRVAFMKPRMLAWTLGVPVMGNFVAPPDVALRELCDRRITHVVTSVVHEGPGRALRALAENRPQFFQAVFSNPIYRVYRFSGACRTAQTAAVPQVKP